MIRFCKVRPDHVCLGILNADAHIDECSPHCMRERSVDQAPYKVEPPASIGERMRQAHEQLQREGKLETPADVINEVSCQPGKVLQLVPTMHNSLPADTPQQLRDLADRAERGELCSLILAASSEEHGYELHFPSSLAESIVLIELLRERWGQKMQGY